MNDGSNIILNPKQYVGATVVPKTDGRDVAVFFDKTIDVKNVIDNDDTSNTRQQFRMIALDLDGTLLQSNHQVADEQAEYLRQLHASTGIKICIATGRAPPSVYEHVRKLALPTPVPVVCSNGARGFLLSQEETTTTATKNTESTATTQLKRQEIFYTPVDRDVVLDTIQLANSMGYCVQYYLDDGIYANPTTDHHKHLLQLYKDVTQGDILEVEDDFAQFLGPEDASQRQQLPSKLLVRFGKEELDRAYQAFSELLGVNDDSRNSSTNPPRATIIKGFLPVGDWFLEILHPSVNKGTGLQRMCQALSVPIKQTVAMGDGTNDVEFLTMAGMGVAMKNAHESLQKVAHYTMQWTNDENGVTKTIESLRSQGHLVSKHEEPTPVDLQTILSSIPGSENKVDNATTAETKDSETTSSASSLIMPAEWSPHSACLILFPHNSQTFRLEKAQSEILHLVQQVVTQGKEDVYLLCKDATQAEVVKRRVAEMQPEATQEANKIHVHVCASDDTWSRDTGPIFVWHYPLPSNDENDATRRKLIGLDWNFNAYGGPEEGCYWPCTNDRKIARTICEQSGPIAASLNIHGSCSIPIILEGGSIHTDGDGTLLTTKECLLNPNRNPHLKQEDIEQVLKQSLGVQKVLWLPTGLDADEDTNGHVDNFCCFVEPAHVVLAWTDEEEQDPENYQRCREAMSFLQQSTDAKGRAIQVTKLYLPSSPLRYTEEEAISLAIRTSDTDAAAATEESDCIMVRYPDEKMAASYVNFYIANQAVLVPQFGEGYEETDAQALATLQPIFERTGRTVVGIPSREILLGGGNIHCQTQQVPLAK